MVHLLFQVLAIISTLLLIPTANCEERKTTGSHVCNENTRDLTTDELKIQYKKWKSDDDYMAEQSYIHQSLAEPLVSESGIPHSIFKYYNIQRTILAGRRKCKLNKKSTELMDRSTCPWYLEMNYDNQRFPKTLVNARCKCRRCLAPNSNGAGCQPTVIRIKVLRRELSKSGLPLCSNGTALYGNTWETIAVGCTCEIRKLHKQKHIKLPE